MLVRADASGNAFRIPDEFEVYFQAEHLVDAGDLCRAAGNGDPHGTRDRQRASCAFRTQSMFFGKVGVDGKPYAPYGPLVAVLAVPHHLGRPALASMMRDPASAARAGAGVGDFRRGRDHARDGDRSRAGGGAGFIAPHWRLARGPRMALLFSATLGGASVRLGRMPQPSSASRSWPRHSVWAAALLIEARTAARPARHVAIAALLIIVAGLTKVTSLIVAPAFRRRRARRALNRDAATAARGRRDLRIDPGGSGAATWLECISLRLAVRFRLRLERNDPGHAAARILAIGDIPRGPLRCPAVRAGQVLGTGLGDRSSVARASTPRADVAARSCGVDRDRDRDGGRVCWLRTARVYAAYLFPGRRRSAHGPRHLVPIVPAARARGRGHPRARQRQPSILRACRRAVGLVMAPDGDARVATWKTRRCAAMSNGPDGSATTTSRVNPAPGRLEQPVGRLEHVPLVTAMKTSPPGWSESRRTLARARLRFWLNTRSRPAGSCSGWPVHSPENLPFLWQAGGLCWRLVRRLPGQPWPTECT